jgi:hypothetical protein
VVSFSNSTGDTPRSAGFQFRLGFDSSKLSPGDVTSTLSGVGCNSAGAGVLSCGGFLFSGEYPPSGTLTISMDIAPGAATGSSPLTLSNHEQFDVLGDSIPGTNPDPADGTFTIVTVPPPAINFFAAGDARVVSGASFSLSWTSSNTTSCSPSLGAGTAWPDQGALPASGARSLLAPQALGMIIFGLSCTDGVTQVSSTTEIEVVSPGLFEDGFEGSNQNLLEGNFESFSDKK